MDFEISKNTEELGIKSKRVVKFAFDLPMIPPTDREAEEVGGELIERFGSRIILQYAIDGIVRSLRAYVSSMIAKEKTDAEILTAVETWKPRIQTRRGTTRTPLDAALRLVDQMTPEERSALLDRMTAPEPTEEMKENGSASD